jgi:hypothetical protein
MKKLSHLLLCLSLLSACTKEPSPNTIYYARGKSYQYKPNPTAANTNTPVSTSGTLVIKNNGQKCFGVVLQRGNKLLDVEAGGTREYTLEAGDYTYSLICGFFPDCGFLSGTLKNDVVFSVRVNEKTNLTLSCF